MELISIIVPIYKVEKYLERCVQSIQAQTYSEIEIILVDDGSPDKCPLMCDKYAEMDDRIRVIHKPNGGLSDARNAGLEIAKGNLIAFVDSDDWISPYFLETMYQAMVEHKADIVECGFIRIVDNGEVPRLRKNPQVFILDAENALKKLIEDVSIHQTVWNKLYRKRVIQGILFPINKYNEDEFWTYQVLGRVNTFVKVNQVLYYYFQNETSIMGQGYKLKRLDAIEAKVKRQVFIEQHFMNLTDIAATDLIGSIIYAGQMSLLHLNGEEQSDALRVLAQLQESVFGRTHYHFIGKPKHIIWNYMSLWNLQLTCKLRNRLRINIE